MATGLEAAIARTAGQIIRQLGGHVGKQAQLRKARDAARPLMAREVAGSLLGELDASEAAELADYLVSPDFEQVALQFAVARLHQRDRQREELLSAARDQIRQGLRLATSIPDERRLGVTDVVYDALLAAEHTPGNPAQSARLGHLTAMAARNGELLGGLTDLAASRDEARRLRAQAAELHAELRMPHTGVSRSVPWERLYVESQPHDLTGQAAPVRELAQAGRRLVVLGDPGAGKSTLATKLAHDLAADPGGTEVPFLVTLRHLSAALQTGERTLAEHLRTVTRDPYNVTMSAETLDYLLLNGRAVVILDGLDELTDVSLRRRVADLVRGFANLYPMTPIVVTSRRVGYREAALDAALFPVFQLMPFDDEQVRAYAGHWFALDGGTMPAERASLSESFLRDSESIGDLRSNPLLLSLLCAMYSADHYLPALRAQIYERCALMVFERWDGMRGIGRPERFEGRVRGAVQHLAWQLLNGDTTELPRRRISRILVDHLVERRLDEDEAEAAAEDFLAYCAGRAWVLAEIGSTSLEPIYGFAHRTFLEYFAAEHLVRSRRTPAAVWAELEPRLRRGEWEVVAQLALQLMDRNVIDGAEDLVRCGVEAGRHADLHDRRRLACFGGAALQHVALSPQAVERVVGEALAGYFSVHIDDRIQLFVRADSVATCGLADAALSLMIRLCSAGNLDYLSASLAAIIERDHRASDERLDLLLSFLAHAAPRMVAGNAELSALMAEREQPLPHPFEVINSLPRGVLQVLGQRGVEGLYCFINSPWGFSSPPIINLLLDLTRTPAAFREAAFALRDALIAIPTPWLPARRWAEELAEALPAGLSAFSTLLDNLERARPADDEVATILVLLSPYLEAARTGGQLIDVQAIDQVLGLLDLTLTAPRATKIPGEVAEFLIRWQSGELRVLGDQTA